MSKLAVALNHNSSSLAKKQSKSENIQSYLLLFPQILGFLVFGLYPILWVIGYSVFDFDGVKARFNGIENFVVIFTRDMGYWKSILNTLILSFGKLVVELPLALFLAVLLNNKMKGKSFFRMMFYLPNVVSVATIGIIFFFMFSTFEGIVNNMLESVKLIDSPINWFGHKWTAMFVLGLTSLWQNFGINMLFFLSGLMNIPKELYECAEIDGASKTRQFFHITIPMLAPVMQVVCMLAMIGSIKVTDLVLVMTNGQPAGETEVVMTHIFKKFFSYGEASVIPQIGYACALGLVTSVILAVLTVIYLRTTKKMSVTE